MKLFQVNLFLVSLILKNVWISYKKYILESIKLKHQSTFDSVYQVSIMGFDVRIEDLMFYIFTFLLKKVERRNFINRHRQSSLKFDKLNLAMYHSINRYMNGEGKAKDIKRTSKALAKQRSI